MILYYNFNQLYPPIFIKKEACIDSIYCHYYNFLITYILSNNNGMYSKAIR